MIFVQLTQERNNMIPPSILKLLSDLEKETINESISWSYNDDNAKVICTFNGSQINITYHFNEVKEMGAFSIKIEKGSKEYYFGADEDVEAEYLATKRVYDLAQASDYGYK